MARAKQIQERRAKNKADATNGDRVVASNRRARHDYDIIETLECGIVLGGSEVKSLREGKAQIVDSYARIDDDELWLFGMHIPPWSYAVGYGSHDPDRKRKLLVHRHEIDQLHQKTRLQPSHWCRSGLLQGRAGQGRDRPREGSTDARSTRGHKEAGRRARDSAQRA